MEDPILHPNFRRTDAAPPQAPLHLQGCFRVNIRSRQAGVVSRKVSWKSYCRLRLASSEFTLAFTTVAPGVPVMNTSLSTPPARMSIILYTDHGTTTAAANATANATPHPHPHFHHHAGCCASVCFLAGYCHEIESSCSKPCPSPPLRGPASVA